MPINFKMFCTIFWGSVSDTASWNYRNLFDMCYHGNWTSSVVVGYSFSWKNFESTKYTKGIKLIFESTKDTKEHKNVIP